MITPYKCPKCGLANAMGSSVCASCGTSLGMPRAATPPRPPTPAAPATTPAPKRMIAAIPPAATPAAAAPAPAPAAPRMLPAIPRTKATPSIALPKLAANLSWTAFCAEIRKSVSLTVIAICTSVYLAATLLNLFNVVTLARTISWLGLSYIGFAQHLLIYQPFTAPFVHVQVFHLVFNMLSVYWLGQAVEARLGKRRYVELSALCALSSMAAFLALSWGTFAVFYGYSSVVFGILTAMAIFEPDAIVNIYYFFPVKMKYAVLVIGGIELMLTLGASAGRGAHWAQLVGALAAFWYLRLNGWRHMAALTARRPAWLARLVR